MDWRRRQRGASGERGYILAILLGICVVMGIFMQKAIPAVRAEVQRDLEAELIYRGEHLARGIRIYKALTNAYPTELEQLLKVKPRLIRRVYKDPMTQEGDWVYVFAVATPKSGDTKGLPFIGVRSRSQLDSFRAYNQKTIYSDWVFSATDSILGAPGSSTKGGDQNPPKDGQIPDPSGRGSGSHGGAPPPKN